MEFEKSKKATLERLIKHTGIIIESCSIDNTLKGYYSQVKRDWDSLKDKIAGWSQIVFVQSDLERSEFYESFSADCKSKMSNIKGICENNLADIDDEIEKLKNSLQNKIDTLDKERAEFEEEKRNFKKYKIRDIGITMTIISLMVGSLITILLNYSDHKYQNGYSNGKSDYANEQKSSLDSIKSVNKSLCDSITSLKNKIVELDNKKIQKSRKR